METSMGIVYTNIELLREADVILAEKGYLSEDQIWRVTVSAMVDSGATMLVIPEFLCKKLTY